MPNNPDQFRSVEFQDKGIPVEISETTLQTSGFDFLCHWHKHMQLYQLISGEAIIYCNYSPVHVRAGDVVLINIDELHYLENLSSELKYRIVKIDFSCLLGSRIEERQVKYIDPLLQHRLMFENRISQDVGLCRCIDRLAYELGGKREGYELAIVACLYDLLAILVRGHVRKASGEKNCARELNKTRQFQQIIDYIEENYCDRITLETLSFMAHMSPEHFCRSFKKLTGRTAMDYINRLRIEKAHRMLLQGNCNVSEAALSTGFSDTNYFSRMFKKYKHMPPSVAM